MLNNSIIKQIKKHSVMIKKLVIDAVYSAQSGHIGGSLSCSDILACLYFSELNVKPENPTWEDRDRFVLSKGHCSPALYAALALRGFFPVQDLYNFRQIDSYLEGHPNMNNVPGVDMSTGSLGQGISAAVGIALAGKLLDHKTYNVYSILGDGELQEGQVWEAFMAAAHYKLNNLICFIDNNGLQIDGKICDVMSPEPVLDKAKAFGWNVQKVDGHSPLEIIQAIRQAKQASVAPSVIVAKTIKGNGVSFMENVAGWHGVPPSKDQRDKAIQELDKTLAELED